ncbi:hypothetical protein, partial [Herbaspirillum sp. YR522]|uniref:hypothetical protein n=1 Tax=Herbaspirillum sp. YR522 TaxID=1144342 RepID=UPI00350FA99A
RNPQSAIRNPQSAIRNPQSATRNPQPATRNPQPDAMTFKTQALEPGQHRKSRSDLHASSVIPAIHNALSFFSAIVTFSRSPPPSYVRRFRSAMMAGLSKPAPK